MPEIISDEYPSPKKVYDDLIKRCKDAQLWPIRCIIEESWTGIAPFQMLIENGIFTCFVIAPTKKDAMLQVMHKLPVVLFLDELE